MIQLKMSKICKDQVMQPNTCWMAALQVRKNPAAYGISGKGLSESAVERVLKDQLILSNVRELAKYGMVCCSC